MQWKWKIQLDNRIQSYSVDENQQQKYIFLIDNAHASGSTHFYFYVKRNAQLLVEILIMHADADVSIDCALEGEGANAHIIGAYIGTSSHTIRIRSLQHHQARNTSSMLVMRGVLYDSAYADYRGTIIIDQKARGSNASQENKNILLSNNARAISVPNLEVLTHDVKCFHGSAIGRLNDEQLLYAAARGIDEKKARQLFLKAFFADMFVSSELNERVLNIIE